MAGVGTDYYVRLELGRERHPSAQVVDALARALGLEDDAVDHLHRLARPVAGGSRARTRPERAGSVLLRMMEGWHRTPAVILDHCLTVLAHNALGRALFAGHTHSGDLPRLVFLDPDAREFYPEGSHRQPFGTGALPAGQPQRGRDSPTRPTGRSDGSAGDQQPPTAR
ncbi:helix-turn-helix transcriptional regulator [Streptomyces sp. SA15]|uniref:helix-turn-helix transcriptional regulator n=1 Tax=Streptomyces sp. SA15 TaxID=934019 RepID=UPI00211CC9FA|nr:helix-turn-helix transcriptional regulator [Streptomyces sp. SA15]